MDEKHYLELAHRAFARIQDAFDAVDADDADIDSAGDVLTITFRDGHRSVVNTQRPARQIWLAGGDRAWHFSWDAKAERWLDDKGSGAELFATLAEIARARAVELAFD